MSYRRRRSSHSYGNRPRQRIFQVISLPTAGSPHSFRVQKWQVRSHSDPSKHYTVSLRKDGVFECSCPQWIYRRRECKHIQEVQDSIRAQAFTQAQTPKATKGFFIKDGGKQFTLL